MPYAAVDTPRRWVIPTDLAVKAVEADLADETSDETQEEFHGGDTVHFFSSSVIMMRNLRLGNIISVIVTG
jgi:hypothetical protein